MPADTVTLNREDVLALLREVDGVATAIESVAGACPTPLTGHLTHLNEVVLTAMFGEPSGNGTGSGGHEHVWERGRARATELLTGKRTDG